MYLLDEGFARYGYQSFFVRGNICATAPVGKGAADQVDLAAASDVGLIYAKDADNSISYALQLNEGVNAPVFSGQVLGRIIVYNQGHAEKEVELLAVESVPRGGVFRQIMKAIAETLLI
jgi:D-alanyl-D-alanine carboxypeptidase (penicillin-binding protein 5/6)